MVKTLDERIREDLKDLYNNGKMNGIIDAAKELQEVIKGGVSTKGLPGHFTGNRSAKTVFVTLNPGQDAEKADDDKTKMYEIAKLGIDIKNGSDNFIASYIEARTDFGNRSKGSAFDVKQARFLREWEKWQNSGKDFPKDFPKNKKTYPEAKRNVLLHKLQLELVPYCSKTFEINDDVIDKLFTFIEMLLAEIFSFERKYVIFASGKFELLFKLYNIIPKAEYTVVFSDESPQKVFKIGHKDYSIQSRCKACKIIRTSDNKYVKSLIAHTFPYRMLNGDNMSLYGKFCYEEFKKYMNSNP